MKIYRVQKHPNKYIWVDPPTGETIESATRKGYPIRYAETLPEHVDDYLASGLIIEELLWNEDHPTKS